ncbi:MAG TPA: hypothetical protein VMT03_05635 [Polyangia bacterium]|nr:hypothetical protein [Polyangia bacterium]
MSGPGDAAQTRELTAAAHRLAALADRIRELRNQLAGLGAPASGAGERGTAGEEVVADGAKGDGR